MRRADRLLQIVQALRRHRGPVTAQALADELEVSRRTIYRDMLDLQAGLVPIEGEAGVGYVLRPGYDLPPLMFTVEEVEAIVLGARLARDRGDAGLARAADDVLAKVAAVLPPPLATVMERSALLVPSRTDDEAAFGQHMPVLRRAVRERTKLAIGYANTSGAVTERVVWPLALLFFSNVTLLGSWCELRSAYRFFRTDRITSPWATGQRFDTGNGAMLDALMENDCTQS
ncbi:YafY family protein [Devosia sp. 2618]|uniref:helix-turn-helix transcriptional regulator n=1 Tax=Devosia sp. 2618 TaxID=3156454 RepID=UPI00339267A2